MKKLISLSIILFLIVNLSFSQTENNDILSNTIEELKQEIRSKGLANLDRIEGIYEFKRTGGPYGWKTEWLNKTTTENTYIYIRLNPGSSGYSEEKHFQIFEYEAEYGEFKAQNWNIIKAVNKYSMIGYGKDYDHAESEIIF